MDYNEIREIISRTRKGRSCEAFSIFLWYQDFFHLPLLQRYPKTFHSLQDRDTWLVVSGVVITMSLIFLSWSMVVVIRRAEQSIALVGGQERIWLHGCPLLLVYRFLYFCSRFRPAVGNPLIDISSYAVNSWPI